MSPVVSVVVEDSSVRRAGDFARHAAAELTRRAYLHRKAKEEGKGTASADRGPLAAPVGRQAQAHVRPHAGRTPGEAADSPSGAAGTSSPLVASPKLRRQPTPIVGYAAADATGDQSHIAPPTAGSGGGAAAVAADEEDEERRMPLSLSCAARCVLSPSDRAQHARHETAAAGGAREPGTGLLCAGALWDAVAVSASDDASRPGHGRRSQPVPLGGVRANL